MQKKNKVMLAAAIGMVTVVIGSTAVRCSIAHTVDESAQSEADLVDLGLRYDLTLPLARFYANNANRLPSPFKALQIGSVWLADRPQRGRYRQFTQCDIDILGEPSNLAEIELILATTTTLGKLGFSNFEIRINEREILKAMAAYSGFPEDAYESIFITLDKMDKIGLEGVEKELKEVKGVKLALGLDSVTGPLIPDVMVPNHIKEKLNNGTYQMIYVMSEYKTGTDEVNAQCDAIREIIKRYDETAMLIGEAPCTQDLITITDRDFKIVNAASIVLIFLIIAMVLKSVSLPVILVAVIEFAIFINM